MVEPLSEREREVLTLLSGMLSTAEIAAEMYLSVNTVKTHLRSIYRKLSAAHRGEAGRRARQMELQSEGSQEHAGFSGQCRSFRSEPSRAPAPPVVRATSPCITRPGWGAAAAGVVV